MTLAQIIRIGRQRLRSLADRRRIDAELDREFAFHLDQLVKEHIAEGMNEQQAREAARRSIGNVTALEEQCRDQRRVGWLHDLKQDLEYGLRMLRQSPGFTLVAIASLALGIGANTAILGALDTALSGSLPLPDADRLMRLEGYLAQTPGIRGNSTIPEYFAWKQWAHSYESLGASISNVQDFAASDMGGPPERVNGHAVTPSLFPTLGVRPMLGRWIQEEDSQIDYAARVMVLGYGLWRRRFGSDPEIVNREIRVDGEMVRVIGVMPEGFWFPIPQTEYWIPMGVTRTQLLTSARFYAVAARLKPGVTVSQAQAELDALSSDLAREYPEQQRGWRHRARPLRETWYGWTRQPLWMLAGAGLLVLLIACANLATLLIARGAVRQPEFAMRAALGASRGRIARQLLTESVLLSLSGGALGLVVAWVGSRMTPFMLPPPDGVAIGEIDWGGRMLAAATAISVLAGLTFGIGPVLARLSDLNLARHSRRTPSGERTRGILVAGQIALALVLLIGSGLLAQSFVRSASQDRGFDPHEVLSFDIRFPPQQYLKSGESSPGIAVSEARSARLEMQRIHERLRRVPGIVSVAGASSGLVNVFVVPSIMVLPEGRPVPVTTAEREALNANCFLVTPGYFRTIRGKVIRGREIEEGDTAGSAWVAVVNETMARRFWPGQDAMGQRFTLDAVTGEQPRVVVGVVQDVVRLESLHQPAVYTSYLQQADRFQGRFANRFGQMSFAVRAHGDPGSLIPAVRQAVAEVNPDRPVSNAFVIVRWGGFTVFDRGLYAGVLLVFSGVATLLAAMGIYGVMAYSVAQRTREIGIRIALGADKRQIIVLYFSRALGMIGAGLIVGLLSAWALTRLLTAQLWAISPTDPATFAMVSLLLAGIAAVACLIPVRRALRIDPVRALNSE